MSFMVWQFVVPGEQTVTATHNLLGKAGFEFEHCDPFTVIVSTLFATGLGELPLPGEELDPLLLELLLLEPPPLPEPPPQPTANRMIKIRQNALPDVFNGYPRWN